MVCDRRFDHRGAMRATLLAEMQARGGIITRRCALHVVQHHVLDRAVSGGAITRVFPQVFVLSDLVNDDEVLDRAALAYVPGAALSHTSALRVWSVGHDPIDGRRHVTTGPRAQLRATSGLIVHRQRDVRCTQPQFMVRRGVHVTAIEAAIVASWTLVVPTERRKPAITAVSAGITTGDRLLRALSSARKPAGAAEMRPLFELLALGCRSELELWGHNEVFGHPSLSDAVLQHAVPTAAGMFVLDRAYLEEMVGVELDGAAWHGSASQRERDVRRDAALAAAGWLIVRFTHSRLRRDPAGCREELRRILISRRRQLRVS